MNLTRRIAYNMGVQLFGKALITVLSLVLIGVITRTLGVAGYGQYTTAFSFVLFFGVLADLGFFSILTREVSRDPTSQYATEATNAILTVRTIIAVCVYALAVAVAFLIPVYPLVVKVSIALLSGAMLLSTLNSTLVAVFQAHLKMDRAVLSDLIGRVVIVAGVLAVAQTGNLLLIISSYIVGNFVNLALSVWFMRRLVKLRWSTDWVLIRRLAREAIPLGVIIILVSVYFKVDAVILSLMRSSEDVGIYGAGFKILEVLNLIPYIFVGSIFPVIVQALEHERERVNGLIQQAVDVLAVMVFPVSVGVIVLAPQIIQFIAGRDFVAASTVGVGGVPLAAPHVLMVLMTSLIFGTFSVLFAHVALGLNIQRRLILPNLIFVIFNVGTNIIFIPYVSYMGAAVITVLTELLVFTVYAGMIGRMLKFKFNAAIVVKAFAAALVMATAVLLVSDRGLALSIVVGGFVYAGLILALRAVPESFTRLIARGQE